MNDVRQMEAGEASGIDSRHAWAMVAAVFVVLSINSGLGFYNLSVYLRVLSEQRGFSLTETSAATATFFVSSGLAGLIFARVLRVHDPRSVIALGAVLGAACIYAIGVVRSVPALFTVYAVFGIAFTGAGLLPSTMILTQWFRRQRSKAISVASTGLSVGGVIITPASASLMERWGVQRAAPVLAAVWLLGILPAGILILRAGPLGGRVGAGPASASEGLIGAPLRHPFFLRMNVSYFLLLLAQVAVLAHLYTIGSEVGGGRTAAAMVSLLAVASVVGRLAGGWILVHISSLRFASVLIVLQSAALTLMAASATRYGLLISAMLLGVCVGNLLMMQSLLIAEAFGAEHYGSLFATSQLVTTCGYAAGAWLLGEARVYWGGYPRPLVVLAGVTLVAAGLLASSTQPTTVD